MSLFSNLEHSRVFEIFENLTKIPHPSTDCKAIADYVVKFAENLSLKVVRDEADNVVIYKNGTFGLQAHEPVILQGHLDMVAQMSDDSKVNPATDPLDIYIDGDFVKARGTTLGADNGIAVAMVLAVLESDSLAHPPIEAVFTSDEEIGMIGAGKLDVSILKSKRMINLDSEEDDTLTVSCAGGADVQLSLGLKRVKTKGTLVEIKLNNLLGGHSGVEINKGRQNANILLGRVLNHLYKLGEFSIVKVQGGSKPNAIADFSAATLCVQNGEGIKRQATDYLNILKTEIAAREPEFSYSVDIKSEAETDCFSAVETKQVIAALTMAPNGVMEMSADINGLVETSLNLGILTTENEKVTMHFALRSNKLSALAALEEKMCTFAETLGFTPDIFGFYPAWEFVANSCLQDVFCQCFEARYGKKPKVEAIHAGLECGVFASKIKNMDCIAFGPSLFDVHTVNEKMSIPSVQNTYKLLTDMLKVL